MAVSCRKKIINRVVSYFDETRVAGAIGTGGELALLAGGIAEGNLYRVAASLLGLSGQRQLLLHSGNVHQRWGDAGKWWIAQVAVLLASGAAQAPHDAILALTGGLSYLILNVNDLIKTTDRLLSKFNLKSAGYTLKIHTLSKFLKDRGVVKNSPKASGKGFLLRKAFARAGSVLWNDLESLVSFKFGTISTLFKTGLKTAWYEALYDIKAAGPIGVAAKVVIWGSALYILYCLGLASSPACAALVASSPALKQGIDLAGIGLAFSWIAASAYQLKVEQGPAIDTAGSLYYPSPETPGQFKIKEVREEGSNYTRFVESVKPLRAVKKAHSILQEEKRQPGMVESGYGISMTAEIRDFSSPALWPQAYLAAGTKDPVKDAAALKSEENHRKTNVPGTALAEISPAKIPGKSVLSPEETIAAYTSLTGIEKHPIIKKLEGRKFASRREYLVEAGRMVLEQKYGERSEDGGALGGVAERVIALGKMVPLREIWGIEIASSGVKRDRKLWELSDAMKQGRAYFEHYIHQADSQTLDIAHKILNSRKTVQGCQLMQD
jgi:hypothetical protein